MISSGMWTGGSLAIGIVMILIGLVLILFSLPLAKGLVKAHEYNYRPWPLYKLTDEERDRLGKPTAMAAIVIALLYVEVGIFSITLATTGNGGPVVLYLFLGTIVTSALALLVIMFASIHSVKRAREKSPAR